MPEIEADRADGDLSNGQECALSEIITLKNKPEVEFVRSKRLMMQRSGKVRAR